MKHAYSDRFTAIPAMILEVRVFAIGTPRSRRVPAKIDTGADLCVLPDSIVSEVRLAAFGFRMLRAVGHPAYKAPTYWAGITMSSHDFTLEVVSHSQPYALLGRDLLNQLKLIADGPNETFELLFPGD
jgi:predicted aspartyl protease